MHVCISLRMHASNIYTYPYTHAHINTHAHTQAALSIIDMMQFRDSANQPNAISYNAVIDACASRYVLMDIHACICVRINQPNAISYNAVIDACAVGTCVCLYMYAYAYICVRIYLYLYIYIYIHIIIDMHLICLL